MKLHQSSPAEIAHMRCSDPHRFLHVIIYVFENNFFFGLEKVRLSFFNKKLYYFILCVYLHIVCASDVCNTSGDQKRATGLERELKPASSRHVGAGN